ncbi:MAG: FUSC family protein [Desulfobacterales bacterium]
MIIKAGPQEGSAFHFAAYRTMETIAGIVIWTVVSVFIWPRSSRKTLDTVSRQLMEAMKPPLDGYRDELLDHGMGDALQRSRAQAGKLVGQLGQTIAAAASESYEVHEVRHLWERLHGLSGSMLEVLDRLQPGLKDLQKIDLEPVAGDLRGFFSMLDARLRNARGMLGGDPPGGPIEAILPSFSAPEFEGLNHFQRAAAEVMRTELKQLGPLIFAFTFVAAYFFTGMARAAIYLSVFNMLGISNQQTYNFATQANAFVFTMLGIMLVVACTYITRSPRPEKAFKSMLSRFFRSCEFLVSQVVDPGETESLWGRMQRAYYRQELRLLPDKLGTWGHRSIARSSRTTLPTRSRG